MRKALVQVQGVTGTCSAQSTLDNANAVQYVTKEYH